MTVDIEDVFDEFSFGAHDPSAIKAFLSLAHSSWRTAPSHVLLVGNASFDPRNYLGYGFRDLVPTKQVITQYMKTASDDWLTDFDGDGVADIPIGRLPALGSADLDIMVGKAVSYARAPAGDWSSTAVMVADAADGQGNDFPSASNSAASLLPASLTVNRISVDQLGSAGAREALLSQLASGALFVNYVGHGTEESWAIDGIFGNGDAYAMTNGNKLPFVTSMTCLTGLFDDDIYGESLAEALLRSPNGGAVAVWASSGLTFLPGQAAVDRELVNQLFGASTTLGEAVRKAKLATTDPDVRRTWNLLGDPSTKLRR